MKVKMNLYNLILEGIGVVVSRLWKYVYFRNVCGEEANAAVDEYIAHLREFGDGDFADAVEIMRKAGARGGIFYDKLAVVGFLDGYGKLNEIDGADYCGEQFVRNYFRGVAPSVGHGFKTMVKEEMK